MTSAVQGQSGYTRFKAERFGPVLAQSLLISKAAKVSHFAYYHVDLNAGGGYNEEVHVEGSPLNFLRAAARHHRPNFYAFFVDREPACIRRLITLPAVAEQPGRISIFQADNSEILPVVSEFVAARERNPSCSMGSILIDPNGYHGGVPWDALRVFCAAHPRFDLFINLNVRSFRLERPHIQDADGGGWGAYTLHPISTFATWFSRPHWMWTPPCQIKGSSWIQLVGRTMRTESIGYSRLGFYDSQSERGQQILCDVERPSPPRAPRDSAEFPLLQNL